MAVRDPETERQRAVGWAGRTDAVVRYLAHADSDDEIDCLGLNRPGPPVHAAELPVPFEQTLAWGEYLLPAGFVDGFAVSLYSDHGRHLGLASFFTDVTPGQMAAHSHLVDEMRPFLARALDRLPSLAALADLSGDVLGGVALTRAGVPVPLPEVPGHPALTAGTPVLTYAREQLAASGSRVSFLAPVGSELVNITALDCREPATDHLHTVVLVRPPGQMQGLRLVDLQLLGARLDGWSEHRIAAHFRQPLETLPAADSSSSGGLTELLLSAGREGLYVPPALW